MSDFWTGRRVLLTGHTGFKGAWLTLWLHDLGARVTGFSLPADRESLFRDARIEELCEHIEGDLRNVAAVRAAVERARPEVVIHMGAQALVIPSYEDPVGNFATNVMGTVHLLEACRTAPSVRAILNVTTDKVYENFEWEWPYRETDRLGGKDPYSSSKACAELVTKSYTQSFFAARGDTRIATARAGNVIGGGDWAVHRLIPDCLRSLRAGEPVSLRYPRSVRPWQFVLDPLSGYLALAEKLVRGGTDAFSSWNFAPDERDMLTVETVVRAFLQAYGDGHLKIDETPPYPEARVLRLDNSKARAHLAWKPRLDSSAALTWTAAWYRDRIRGNGEARALCRAQLKDFEGR